MENDKVRISNFDYDAVHTGLLRYLRTHEDWKDYNLNSGGMSSIIKVLAYHATQKAIETNITFNELHLDSAQLYDNVCSDASLLSYVPGSKTGSSVTCGITVIPSDPTTADATIILSKYAKFVGVMNNISYIFTPDETYTSTFNVQSGQYAFENVVLIQGIRTISTFEYAGTAVDSFSIPNANIDINTLNVAIQKSEYSLNQDQFEQFYSPHQLDSSANLYYIQKNRFGFYEIEFGDNQISIKPNDGNIVICDYIVTDGIDANGVNAISSTESIGGYSNISVSLDAPASGGSDFESIESIKLMAPKTFSTQGNAVTANDYQTITKRLYSSAEDVIAWGGEQNDPKMVGYVMISIKPSGADTLTTTQKESVINRLERYNVGSITPKIVDPGYYYLRVNTDIKFDPSLTSIKETLLKVKIKDYITTYSNKQLGKFSTQFICSTLVEYINKIDKSIVGNTTSVSFEKRVVPNVNKINNLEIKFHHIIEPGTVKISGFTVANTEIVNPTYTIYDESGFLTMKIVTIEGNTSTITKVGTVDYTTGIITINNFIPTTIVGDYMIITADSGSHNMDVFPGQSEIITVNTDNINVTLTSLRA